MKGYARGQRENTPGLPTKSIFDKGMFFAGQLLCPQLYQHALLVLTLYSSFASNLNQATRKEGHRGKELVEEFL